MERELRNLIRTLKQDALDKRQYFNENNGTKNQSLADYANGQGNGYITAAGEIEKILNERNSVDEVKKSLHDENGTCHICGSKNYECDSDSHK